MRISTLLVSLSCLAFAPTSLAWGAAGHEIVATIAEIHIVPSVLAYLRSPDSRLLPAYAQGHLAPVAAWADAIRGIPEFRGWSGPLHYTGWEGDHPPEVCAWPDAQDQHSHGDDEGDDEDHGHWNSEHDVLHAIANYTERLDADPTDWVSLRFLVHFLGDVHQPLHLTSRERGGNGDPVLWEGRRTNMHSLWDGLLIARALRETTNYTRPVPSQQIEQALTGRIYDPYIRLLLWEGVRSWWRDALPAWLSCGSSQVECAYTTGGHTQQLAFRSSESRAEQRSTSEVVCPFVWASETHKTTCALGFPANYDDDLADTSQLGSEANEVEIEGRLLEVGGNSPFYRKIRDTKAVERLLVQGGLRLAATLNIVLGPAAEQAGFRHFVLDGGQDNALTQDGVYLGWLKEADGL